MSPVIGIDLGTTNCAVARIDEHGYPVVVPNILGEPITPSVICFRDGEIIVGSEAKELQVAGETEVAAFFKRRMGNEDFVFHGGGKDYSAIDLSTLLLSKLKTDAETVLGVTLREAVITVPAYFRNPEREATKAAAVKAGLNVLQLINEPTAAAIAYGIGKNRQAGRILVYDLGGGTFDVTLCDVAEGEVRVLTANGDHELGGKDWDDRIVQFAATAFEREFGFDPHQDHTSIADLQAQAEEAKKRLSSTQRARISIVHGGYRGSYEITREEYEELTRDLMQRTVDLTKLVLKEMNEPLESVGQILLVGGSTRMPMVHQFIREAFGKAPLQGVNVDEAVALGAALVAAEARPATPSYSLRSKVRAADVTNHSLGMIALNPDRTGYINSIILPKNLPIPSAESRPYRFRTTQGQENQVEIFMTQGELSSPGEVTYIAKYTVHDIAHVAEADVVLDIEYAYDRSGTVQVTGRLHNNRRALRIVADPLPADLPDRFLGPPAFAYTIPEHVTAYIAIDLSGSMAGEPLENAQQAAHRFVDNIDLANCSVGIIAVADRVLVKQPASQSALAIREAISALEIGDVGIGNAAHPFDEAYTAFARATGKRFLIVLTDGVWNQQKLAIGQAERCHHAGIEVIAIGFGGADETFLRAIASSDQAKFLNSLSALSETFGSIAQVITEAGDVSATMAALGRIQAW